MDLVIRKDAKSEGLVRYFTGKPCKYGHVSERTPPWLTNSMLSDIEGFYKQAQDSPEDMHVDHIVPLQGEFVSGLHVPWNLQVIPASDNLSKGNTYDPVED